MPSGVLIIGETRDGQVRSVTADAASAGRRLADAVGGPCSALLAGSGIAGEAPGLGAYGVDRVFTAEGDIFGAYSGSAFLAAVSTAVEAADPAFVVLAATSTGKDLAPRIAAALDSGLAATVTDFSAEGGEVVFTRPVYAGKIFQQVKLTTPVGVVSVRPKAFDVDAGRGVDPEVVSLEVAAPETGEQATAVEAAAGASVDLTEADRIISGGRGMGGPENWPHLEAVAEVLGAELGASRAVVDAGWRPHTEQVGQTGKVVTPQLYVAAGISGAMQHLAGMSRSKVIVAINRDAEAPIFGVADFGIVGNALEVLPRLAEELKAAGE
jgi:electron transfer flavoprotein alpha subunit